MNISKLWYSTNSSDWEDALDRYWDGGFIKEQNVELEESLNTLDLERLRSFSPQEWYDFLHDEYFRWKYTAPNRYATTTYHLKKYVLDQKLDSLDTIRQRLLSLDTDNIRMGLSTAKEIKGLGIAGASGLLSLMYPEHFGTVDQFAVGALAQIKKLPEASEVSKMDPNQLGLADGVLLNSIYTRKAKELNQHFGSTEWTPRKLDMVLWVAGR
jgi:hypothetical protein